MNILILGSGGREHAFAWKLVASPKCERLYVAPGNAGTAKLAENLAVDPNDFPAVAAQVIAKDIHLVIVGPEEPLARGVRDYFDQHSQLKKVLLVGPGKEGALLESSKDFAKRFMNKYGIPTARHRTFNLETLEEGLEYLRGQEMPIVLKADGLAAGKGVVICQSLNEAERVLHEMLAEAKFGTASSQVVVEQFLDGIEVSVFVLTDGNHYKVLPEAKDYKRIGDGDTGPNTGGMGAISPVPFVDREFMQKVEQQIIIPTIEGLKHEDIHYRGFIFLGLINVEGNPMVIEYNVRMGDPETQAVLPRLKTDMVDLMTACARGKLSEVSIEIDRRSSATVVMVSGGYPDTYQKGYPISGLEQETSSVIFHAGTNLRAGTVHTNGGRVLAITSLDGVLENALDNVYQTVSNIAWEDANYRRDIGQDLLVNSNKSV